MYTKHVKNKSCNFGKYSTWKDNEIIMAVIDISMDEHGKVKLAIKGMSSHQILSQTKSQFLMCQKSCTNMKHEWIQNDYICLISALWSKNAWNEKIR